MSEWIRAHQTLLGSLVALSVLAFLGGLALMPFLVSRMRPDYFVHPKPTADSWSGRHPAIRLAVRAFKNAFGILLLLFGLAMLPLPGPGLITILVGISLLEFPGKRRLELRIVRQRPVLRAIGWMRARAGRPPLELPPEGMGD